MINKGQTPRLVDKGGLPLWFCVILKEIPFKR